MGDLFFNSWSTASLYYVVNHPLFIAGIILLILLILLIVFVCCYSTYKRNPMPQTSIPTMA